MRKIALFLLIAVCITGAFLYLKKTRPQKVETYPPEPETIKVEEVIKIKPSPKVALVLDDFGYNMRNVDQVFELGAPATFSILPNLPYSERIAEKAGEHDYEIILHLPLEPSEDDRPLEKTTIFTYMEPDIVLQLLNSAIASVPHLVGISNHMGSLATEDENLMSIIFERAKEDNLFFLDSLVTPNTVCKRVSGDIGIKYVQRSVFLDNESDLDYIKGQICQLRDQALKTGWAVGIGHDRAETLSAIKEMIPELKKDGIEFVFLSELAK